MLKRWIDSLFQGTWHLQNGDVFTCGPSDLHYYYNRAKEMLTSGIPIPVCLEHQPTVGLSHHEKMQAQTAQTVGHIHDARIHPEGYLQFLVDGSEQDHDILRRNKFVSPEIRQNVIDPRNGQRWQGPSIVHLACTPRPVQITGKPHVQLSNANAISLSAITVEVSLSSASFKKKDDKDKSMPAKKPPIDEDDDATPPDDATDDSPGDDLDLGGGDTDTPDPLDVSPPPPPDMTPPPAVPSGDPAQVGAAIAELTSVLEPMGIMFHASSTDTALAMLQHMITAVKTHKATKDGGGANQDDASDDQDPNQADPNSQDQTQEPEVAETAPIMMSTTPTPLESLLTKKILKDSLVGRQAKINALHAHGHINDAIKSHLLGNLNTIKLSASDIDPVSGDVKPLGVDLAIECFEMVMKAGKPGPFAKPKAEKTVNPLKPISSTVSLSTAEEEAVESPFSDEDKASRDQAEKAGDDLAERSMCAAK